MTVCGLVRLDGVGVRRAVLTTMLAASASGLPAARGVHTDGAFGAVSAADAEADPTSPIAVDDAGLVVIADAEPRAAGARRSARASAAAYRAGGRWALLSPAATVTVVWEPARSRLVLARPSGACTELVTWSDGRLFAFGTEIDQVLSAAGGGLSRPARLGRLGSGEVVTVVVPAPRRRPVLVAVRQRTGAAAAPGLAPVG